MSSETLCQLLARRRKILNNRKAPIRLEIDNPYINADGTRNNITSYDLAMRRKAEILQYNNTSTVQGKLTSAQNFRNVIENIGRTNNVIIKDGSSNILDIINVTSCPDDLFLPTSTTSAGIPGPNITIQYDPNVPLYGYAKNVAQPATRFENIPDAWTFNGSTNIPSFNGEFTTLLRIFHNIDNIDNELVNKDYEFLLDVPIGIYVAGDISGQIIGSTNNKFISNIEVQVLDHSNNVLNVSSDVSDSSFNDISFNYTIDNSNNFHALEFIGNLKLSLQLRIEHLVYYEVQVKFTLNNDDTNVYTTLLNESSYVSAVYMNLTENNISVKNNINIDNIVLYKNGSTHNPLYNSFNITANQL